MPPFLPLPASPLFALIPLAAVLTAIPILEVGQWSVRPIDLVLLAYAGLLLPRGLLRDRVSQLSLMPLAGIALVLMSTALGAMFRRSHNVDITSLLRFIEVLTLGALVAVHSPTTKWIDRFLLVLVLAAATLSATSLGLLLVYPDLHRVAGWFSAAGGGGRDFQASFNEIGAFLVLALLANWNLLRKRDRGAAGRFLLVACFPLLVAGILLTQSRASVLALAVLGITWIGAKLVRVLQTYRIRPRMIILSVLVLILGTSALLVVSTMLPVDRIAASFQQGTSAYESIAIRLRLWESAARLWSESLGTLLLGHGYGGYSVPLGARSAHNFALDMVLSIGALGFVGIAFAYIGPLIHGLLRAIPRLNLLLAVYVLLLVVTLTSNIAVDPVYGGTTIALLIALAGEAHR